MATLLSRPTARKPFLISPDPSMLYMTPTLKTTLYKVDFVVENRQGLTLIMGDAGLGKSSVLRLLLSRYSAREETVVTQLIPTPAFSSDFMFLKAICAEFDIPGRRSMLAQLNEFRAYLMDLYSSGKTALLLIDEAQKLPGKQLELIRTLLNFETSKEKLIQIVLAAQLELRDKLRDKTKKALRSRVFAPSLLASMSIGETKDMIAYRCEQAEIKNPFTDEAIEMIYTKTGGVPRQVLQVCALGYDMGQRAGVDKLPIEIVEMAAQEAIYHDDLEDE
jgi:general secretion pathway protein A